MTIHLVLFFTRGVSLRTWETVGNLDRETALYQRLIQDGFEVSFVTYGDRSDLTYANRLGGIRVLCNEADLPFEQYVARLERIHERALSGAHVFKTNQSYGADIAARSARRFGKPLVARCGYMWSYNAAREHGIDSPEAVEARRVEGTVFGEADCVVVTTPAMKADVEQRIPSVSARVHVIPNYVDTEVFAPNRAAADPRTLLFIGRIAKEKNLPSLLDAVSHLDVKLIIIGEGPLRPELRQRYASLDGKVTWQGSVPNAKLPEYLNAAGIFVLPSHYEGHPKSLIEAMTAGVPVIGADSPGIRDLIRQRDTGLLCTPSSEGIRSAIETLLADPGLAANMGVNARSFGVEHYGLDKIAGIEAALLRVLVSKQPLPATC